MEDAQSSIVEESSSGDASDNSDDSETWRRK